MPNTLAHFAVNGLVTGRVVPQASFKWVALGCVIPDLPWILQRLLTYVPTGLDLYDVRAWFVVQSSLVFCLLLSAAIALCAKRPGRVFVVLAIGSFLHLLLDAVQIKWANGVQLLAPFNWSLWRLDWFWPESIWTYLLTGAGLVYAFLAIRRTIRRGKNSESRLRHHRQSGVVSTGRRIVGLSLLGAWAVLPYFFVASAYDANNHYINTLRDTATRTGQPVEFDRVRMTRKDGKWHLHTPFGEQLTARVTPAGPGLAAQLTQSDAAVASLRGKFADSSTVLISAAHSHSRFREMASAAGLVVVLLVWLMPVVAAYGKPSPRKRTKSGNPNRKRNTRMQNGPNT